MRRLMIIIVLFFVFLIGLGYVAQNFGIVDSDDFYRYATLAGTFASVMGLVAIALPRFSRSDIRELELGAIERIREAVEKIEDREKQLSRTEEELSRLEIQK